ncbi:hypothetical protein SteCoe_18045 [Stentor coeruleus]|uniref:EF-hand domain-containing protein n=1 Tax=Stentor coeruleus TaxID=5963 RepID=A0A1R2BXE4_9CILI|nr:hypothetical protein SteCoe_18045 [Stentor coeruleus]
MKNGLLIGLLLISALGQVEQDESAESITIPEGDLESITLTTDATSDDEDLKIIMDYSDELVNTTDSQQDSQNSIGINTLSLSLESTALFLENQLLSKEIDLIEEQLLDATEKAVNYRIAQSLKYAELAEEMEMLAEFNEQVVGKIKEDEEKQALELAEAQEEVESEKIEESQDEDEDIDEDLEESHGFLYALGLAFLFILLFTVKKASNSLVYSAFIKAIYSLLVSFTVLAIVVAVLTVVKYADFIEDHHLYFDSLYQGCMLFTIIWFGLGVWLVFICQAISINWEKLEDQLCDKEVPEQSLEFAIMRKLFIVNPYVPIASEYALRPDFNFAEYLKRCMGKVLTRIFTFSWLSFLFIVGFVIIWRVILYQSDFFQLISIWVIPFIYIFISFQSVWKCRKISSLLIPETGEGLAVEYDYLANCEVPVPFYLGGRIPPPGSDFSLGSVYLLKCTCSYIFLGTYPNRHQLLFWFDCFGVKFMGSLLQTVCIGTCLWFTMTILYYFSDLFDVHKDLNIALCASCGVALIVLVVYFVPVWIKLFAVVSNIEMMKDKEIIKEVVEDTQGSRMLRNWRLFVQFRSLWRDMQRRQDIEKVEKIPKIAKQIIKEAFGLSTLYGYLYYTQVREVLKRVGIEMDDDQFRVFLKDCELDEEDKVSYKTFIQGIKRLLQDTKANPKLIVSEVLKQNFKHKKVDPRNISEFLERNKWFMQDADIRDFLIDLHFNLDENNQVDVDTIEFTS